MYVHVCTLIHTCLTNFLYQISTCSGLAALDLANTRKSAGLRVTGVGAAVCARQGCIRPLGLGDLQKGERYVCFHVSTVHQH
jgi:hypothetical protein